MSTAAYPNVKFTTSRLPSSIGYGEPPKTIDDSLLFDFPPFSSYTGRDVVMAHSRWEVWSPNSTRDAFLPGKVRRDYGFQIPQKREQRRFDGHLGRFDPTVATQYFSNQYPWHAFIDVYNPKKIELDTIPLYGPWQPRGEYTGRLDPAFVTAMEKRCEALNDAIFNEQKFRIPSVKLIIDNPPVSPTMSDIRQLRNPEMFYEDALDKLLSYQRGFRRKAAWVRMVQKLRTTWPPDVEALRKQTIPPADERFMGVWLNGVDEEMSLWLLFHGRVPCFVVHEYHRDDFPQHYRDRATPDNRNQSRIYSDFYSGTDVQRWMSTSEYGFDRVAYMAGAVRNLHLDDNDHAPPIAFSINVKARSSSWAQRWNRRTGHTLLSPPTNRNPVRNPFASWRPTSYAAPDPEDFGPSVGSSSSTGSEKVLVGSSLALPTESRSDEVPQSASYTPTDIRDRTRVGGGSVSIQSSCTTAPSPLDEVDLAPDRAPWVRPPPIARPSQGSWSRWREDIDEDGEQPCFIQCSKVITASNVSNSLLTDCFRPPFLSTGWTTRCTTAKISGCSS